MMIIFCVMLGLVCLFLGYSAGCRKIASDCENKGYFTAFGTEYHAISKIGQDGKISEFCPPFADGVLGKIKFLDTKSSHLSRTKSMHAILTEDEALKYRRLLTDAMQKDSKYYDCVQCCQDDGAIQNRMILCPECGNKRCPKAQNHRMLCTNSNEVGQLGVLAEDNKIYSQRIDGNPVKNS